MERALFAIPARLGGLGISSPTCLPFIRHNEIYDLTANLLTEVCHEVHVEPKFVASYW